MLQQAAWRMIDGGSGGCCRGVGREFEDHILEGLDPVGMVIEAGDHVELLATGLDEGFFGADADFLDGFEAIGDEGGAHDEDFADAGFGEALDFLVGIGG